MRPTRDGAVATTGHGDRRGERAPDRAADPADSPTIAMGKYGTVRFTADDAPPSLIRRVRFKFEGPRRLKLRPRDFEPRELGRAAPVETLAAFDPADWTLAAVDVRDDAGRFVRTVWERDVDGTVWRIELGFRDAVHVVTTAAAAAPRRSRRIDPGFHRHVEKVNAALMAADETEEGEDGDEPEEGEDGSTGR